MRLALLTGAVLALAGCTSAGSGADRSSPGVAIPSSSGPASASSATPTASSTAAATSRPAPRRTAPGTAAERVFAAMSRRERVGQLIMIDCPSTGVADATRAAITRYDVGSVILDGTSHAGLQATRDVTRQLRVLAPKKAGLFIATDQEGGIVQRLQGPGFDRIPSGVEQGGIAPAQLEQDARTWGRQLTQAGVNVNLSPVLDVVPADSGPNPPIGDLDRQYGSTPNAVTRHGLAFARGMTAAGIDVTVKHFPGLGRVAGNTDTTGGITDTVTTADDAYLAPFRAAVQARVPFVMMSTAIYSRIDPANPAAFSKKIVTGLLRNNLGFGGLIISDDIGAAKQVGNYSPGQRAVRFVAAGGDMVLTVVGEQAEPMTSALLARARSDAAFGKQVDAAALRVLRAKEAAGLLG